MIEHTETIVKLDSKDIAQALRLYIGTKGLTIPTYAKVVIETADDNFSVGGADFQSITATVTVKTGTKEVKE